jgi:hypothetical protein
MNASNMHASQFGFASRHSKILDIVCESKEGKDSHSASKRLLHPLIVIQVRARSSRSLSKPARKNQFVAI